MAEQLKSKIGYVSKPFLEGFTKKTKIAEPRSGESYSLNDREIEELTLQFNKVQTDEEPHSGVARFRQKVEIMPRSGRIKDSQADRWAESF